MPTLKPSNVTLLCLCLAALTAAAAERDGKGDGARSADQDAIQGQWRVVAMVRDGKQYGDDQISRLAGTMQFKGDKVTQAAKRDAGEEGAFVLDPTKKPRRLTIKRAADAAVQVMSYQLDGDTLRLASQLGEQEAPPEDFEPGRGRVVMTLQRDRE